jgi:mlr4682 protein
MELIETLKNLQLSRGDIKTFLLFDGIGPRAVINTRAALEEKEGDEIDVIISSGGGSPDDAYRLIRSFREHYKTVNVIVPFWAKSAATLFTLGASRIVMHEYGELGPIDAQIRKDDAEKPREEWESALNIQASLLKIEELSNNNFVELFRNLQSDPDVSIGRKQLAEMLLVYNSNLYAPLLQRVEVYEMGRMERYLSIGKMYARRIIKQYGDTNSDESKIAEFLDFITYDCPDHGYVIDFSVLKNYLSNVIRSNEEPFSKEYDVWLGKLSSLLMEANSEVLYTGFVDKLLGTVLGSEQNKTKKQKDISSNDEEQSSDDTSIVESTNTESKRSSRKSK